jgi:hypothetical protein
MIRLGLRLTLGSGREAALRVLVMAVAVAMGVGLLLACLAGVNGLHAQTDRGAWLDSAAQASSSTSANQLWWLSGTDLFDNQEIDQVDVAPAGPNAPVPPGISHVPGADEYFASPALTRLLRSEPANELRDRYPGRQIGTIGAAALPSPNSSDHHHRPFGPSALTGARCSQDRSHSTHTGQLLCLPERPRQRHRPRIHSGRWSRRALAAGPDLDRHGQPALGRSARGALCRHAIGRRHAASDFNVVSAVEAVVAGVTGVLIGFALFFVFRPLLYHVPFTGAPFSQGDLSLHWINIMLVAIGVPIAAVVSARLALRRAQGSPLAVQRRTSSHPPRMVRIIPLFAGIALLAYFDSAGKPGAVGGQLLELLVGFVLLVVGLVLAGPWFTTAGSRLMTRRANHPASLIAGRRLLDNPKAAFRFISGLVIALFVASALIGALSSINAAAGAVGGVGTGSATLADPFCSFSTTDCPVAAQVPSVPARVMAELRTTPGVDAVTVVHESPSQAGFGRSFGYVSCEQLAKTPAIGTCAPGASVASVGYFLSHVLGHSSHASTTVWPSAGLSLAGRTSTRRCHRRRHRRIVRRAGTGTDHARAGLSLSRNTGRHRCARSLDRSTPDHDPGHDRRDHRGQPHHRRLQFGREHRCRVG